MRFKANGWKHEPDNTTNRLLIIQYTHFVLFKPFFSNWGARWDRALKSDFLKLSPPKACTWEIYQFWNVHTIKLHMGTHKNFLHTKGGGVTSSKKWTLFCLPIWIANPGKFLLTRDQGKRFGDISGGNYWGERTCRGREAKNKRIGG